MVELKNLKVWFPVRSGVFSRVTGHVKAVDGVSLSIPKGSLTSLVGESGSGKSTLGNALLGLIPKTDGQIYWEQKEVFLNGQDVDALQRRSYQMIYQDSNSSLNPRKSIFEILSQPMIYHKVIQPKDARDKVAEVLELVHLEPDMMDRFPFAFSGGQRQRINIARTLSIEPEFIVCDEIVSALDVSVQAEILELIQTLRAELNLTLLFIGHDLAVVKNISDQVIVMNQGKIEEANLVDEVFNNPQSQYTQQLLASVPSIDLSKRKRKLHG